MPGPGTQRGWIWVQVILQVCCGCRGSGPDMGRRLLTRIQTPTLRRAGGALGAPPPPRQPVRDFTQCDPRQRPPRPLPDRLRQPWLSVLDVCSCSRLSSRFPQLLSSHSFGSSSSDLVHARVWALEISEHVGCMCMHTHVHTLHACMWQALEMMPEPIGCMCVHTRVYMRYTRGCGGRDGARV